MTREEFVQLLQKHHINENLVSFDNHLADGYCVRKNRTNWEVFIRERDKIYDAVGFPSESDALTYLYEELVSIYEVINTQQITHRREEK